MTNRERFFQRFFRRDKTCWTRFPLPPQAHRQWLGAAAVAALIAGGAVESGLVAPNPAHAELRSMAQPMRLPSFADVIERVKPAVVSVRVKVQNVADRDNDDDGQQFSMPDLPQGHPMERFFRQFRDQMPGSAATAARARSVRASSASPWAPASSSRLTAMS